MGTQFSLRTITMRVLIGLLYLGFAAAQPTKLATAAANDYLSPAASEPASLYASPAGSASEVVTLYGAPSEEEFYDIPFQSLDEPYVAASEPVVTSYGSPQADLIVPLPAPSESIVSTYGSPQDDVISSPSEAVSSYRVLQDNVISSPSILQPVSRPIGRVRAKATPRPEPIRIIRNQFSGPNNGDWNYSYESENGIKQEARGEMKTVGDALVNVMSGSYSYLGADGLTYQVDWYADETGFHPSAPHLPQPVVPNHPEVAAAVEQQLRFAEEEFAAAAAASNTNSVSIPLNDLSGYGNNNDDLSGYGSNDDLSGYGSNDDLTPYTLRF